MPFLKGKRKTLSLEFPAGQMTTLLESQYDLFLCTRFKVDRIEKYFGEERHCVYQRPAWWEMTVMRLVGKEITTCGSPTFRSTATFALFQCK